MLVTHLPPTHTGAPPHRARVVLQNQEVYRAELRKSDTVVSCVGGFGKTDAYMGLVNGEANINLAEVLYDNIVHSTQYSLSTWVRFFTVRAWPWCILAEKTSRTNKGTCQRVYCCTDDVVCAVQRVVLCSPFCFPTVGCFAAIGVDIIACFVLKSGCVLTIGGVDQTRTPGVSWPFSSRVGAFF